MLIHDIFHTLTDDDREDSNNDADSMNPFTVPTGMLFYRMAKNLLTEKELEKKRQKMEHHQWYSDKHGGRQRENLNSGKNQKPAHAGKDKSSAKMSVSSCKVCGARIRKLTDEQLAEKKRNASAATITQLLNNSIKLLRADRYPEVSCSLSSLSIYCIGVHYLVHVRS